MTTMQRQETEQQLRALLTERVLVLDGAMGTMIQGHPLNEADFRGERFADWPVDLKGNNDLLSITRPDLISGIHESFLSAGADVIETNTFNANSISMADYEMQAEVRELNINSARLARAAADKATAQTPDKPRFVAGVIGPTNRTASLSPEVEDPGFRNVTFNDLDVSYFEACDALIEGGRGYHPDRDHIRHAECQGRHLRCKACVRGAWGQLAHCDFRHYYRCLWQNPVRTDTGGVLEFRQARQTAVHRIELRSGPRSTS